ncbi:TPA: DeoR family transcriptional regulator [Candidatus Saccharibacteria bacterium]|nr:DeoR family transcriptional regulator [Candidatus Saccharibacteria bacterium]HIO87949.1 DeoR family transcriptional regulator [Candidatus Saccharibacteria bacterium]
MTPRQKKILEAIVEQYAEVASPVGSVTLAKVFGVSSATIRADMAVLEKLGFITHPHTSAGRIPTDKGYRLYVNELQDLRSHGKLEQAASTRSTQVLDRRVEHAGEPKQAIKSAVDSLVEMTDNLGLATIGGTLYMSGLSQLFGQPEFAHGGVRQVAQLLDNLEPWLREAAPNKPLSVFIGQENPIGKNSECTLVISRFRSPYSDNSYIGVLGPTRQSYKETMALVSHAGRALEGVL